MPSLSAMTIRQMRPPGRDPPLPRIVDPGKRLARIRVRQRQGRLQDHRVAPRTRQRYISAFAQVSKSISSSFGYAARTWEELDTMFQSYIEYLWHIGESMGLGSYTLAAVQHHWPRKWMLGSWALLSAWKRNELPQRALPLSPSPVLGLAHLALEQRHRDTCCVLLLGFHAYLRRVKLILVTDVTLISPTAAV
eukprot:959414-Amphidinium_carterae.1